MEFFFKIFSYPFMETKLFVITFKGMDIGRGMSPIRTFYYIELKVISFHKKKKKGSQE